jgi:hypothetical protein
MFDLVSRLRNAAKPNVQIHDDPKTVMMRETMNEAAAEIERLRCELQLDKNSNLD